MAHALNRHVCSDSADAVTPQSAWDVRDDVTKHLQWSFTYASEDPSEARCLVPIESESSPTAATSASTRSDSAVVEWLVRRIETLPACSEHASQAASPLKDTALQHAPRGSLETQLERELRIQMPRTAPAAPEPPRTQRNQVRPTCSCRLYRALVWRLVR